MENTTTYTHDLMFKASWQYAAKGRKRLWIYATLVGLLGIVFIVGDLLIENWHTLYGGVFFLTLSIVAVFSLIQNRKAKVSATIRKQMQENPNRVKHYQFQEDCVVIHETSDNVQSDTRIQYSYIKSVAKIDDTSFYLYSLRRKRDCRAFCIHNFQGKTALNTETATITI